MSRLIIGDVHGCYDELVDLFTKLPEDVPVTFVGDLVDRGPKSAQVVKFVRDGGYDCVRGNHEQMMINYARRYGGIFDWGIWTHPRNGGDTTLASYGSDKDSPRENEQFISDVKWMEDLPVYITYDDVKNENGDGLVVSHSSIGNQWKAIQRGNPWSSHEVMWGRPYEIRAAKGYYNVFGHTPLEVEKIKKVYANIDTGCVFGQYLTAIMYPELEVFTADSNYNILDILREAGEI